MTRLRVVLLGFAVLTAFAVAAGSAGAAPFVYVTSPTPGVVSEFDAAAGTLRPVANAATGSAPFAVAVNPDGTSVYVANGGDDTVSEYDVAADGELSLKSPATVRTGKEPIAIAVNPDGKSVYVANSHDDTLSQYDIGPAVCSARRSRPRCRPAVRPRVSRSARTEGAST